jgi:hypothetical protein
MKVYYLVMESFDGIRGRIEKGVMLVADGRTLYYNGTEATRKGSINCGMYCKEIKIEPYFR